MANKPARRNMDDALKLTPQALAFIQGENVAEKIEQKPAPEQALPKAPPTKKPRRPKRLAGRSREGERTVSAPAQTDEPRPAGLVGQLLVPLTTRLQPKTAEMLRRACLEQKLRGRRPHTQQEIIEAATQSWLLDNGYGS